MPSLNPFIRGTSTVMIGIRLSPTVAFTTLDTPRITQALPAAITTNPASGIDTSISTFPLIVMAHSL